MAMLYSHFLKINLTLDICHSQNHTKRYLVEAMDAELIEAWICSLKLKVTLYFVPLQNMPKHYLQA